MEHRQAAQELVERFLVRAPDSWRALLAGSEAGRLLSGLVDRARAAHPALELESGDFAAELGARAGVSESLSALEAMHVEDLYLVFGCVSGLAPATEELGRRLVAQARAAEGRLRCRGAGDDVIQRLFEELLLARDGRRGIERYTGCGSLDGFLRVAATRTLLRLRRDAGPAARGYDPLELTFGEVRDPELEIIKRRYKEDVDHALRAGVAALTRRQRAVLRLHLVSRMSIDRIGVCYRVHRATAARWLVDAREQLFVQMQLALMARLELGPDEAQSLARLLRSRIDLSLSSFLSTPH